MRIQVSREDIVLFRCATTKWGAQAQEMKCIEECSELIRAFAGKDLRGSANIIEELADVAIMVAQMAEIYGKSEVQEVIDAKIERFKSIVLYPEGK